MQSNAADKPDPSEISALLSDERSILRQTQRAATQFGGIAVSVSFLGKIGFVEVIRKHMRSAGSRRITSSRVPISRRS